MDRLQLKQLNPLTQGYRPRNPIRSSPPGQKPEVLTLGELKAIWQ
jgi:hypothetical protein